MPDWVALILVFWSVREPQAKRLDILVARLYRSSAIMKNEVPSTFRGTNKKWMGDHHAVDLQDS
jgi:hypothetical protein